MSHTDQRKYILCQFYLLLGAGLFAFVFWVKFFGWQAFSFPGLFCGVSYCTAGDTFLHFEAQYFLITVLAVYLLALSTLERFSLKWGQILRQQPYKPWVLGIVVIIFLSAFWEGVSRTKIFIQEDFPHLSEPESVQNMKMFRMTYKYAQKVKSCFPDVYLEAQLISDLDFSTAENMHIHRALAYFLFPLNVRSHFLEGEPKILFFFRKRNALNYIPDGYAVQVTFDPDNLIAVKK